IDPLTAACNAIALMSMDLWSTDGLLRQVSYQGSAKTSSEAGGALRPAYPPTYGNGLVSESSAQRFCCSLKITGNSSRNRRSMRGSVGPVASVQAVVWDIARSFRQ